MWSVVIAAVLVGLGKGPGPELPALAGPSAPALTAARATLVERDFRGAVVRLEIPAEAAAAQRAGLDAEAAARVEALLLERAMLLEGIVGENLELLTKLGGGNRGLGAAALGLEVLGTLEPVIARGPLDAQVRAAIGGAGGGDGGPGVGGVREFDRLLGEYRAAIYAEAGFEGALKERLESFGREIERAFRGMERSGELAFRYLTADLALAADQAARVRELFHRHAEEAGANPTKQQQAALFLSVLAWLTPEQQARAIRKVQELGR